MHYAHQHGARLVNVDVQCIEKHTLETPDAFLHYLAEYIRDKLGVGTSLLKKSWSGSLGPFQKLTRFMENHVLTESRPPVVLAMDEVDCLLETKFYDEFFGLLRSWHNLRASDDRWNRINIVLVISTAPYLLISDIRQSPFNVGLKLYLEDFDTAQVHDLNSRHGSPVMEKDFPQLLELLNGHPYLTRKALFTLVAEEMSWSDLTRIAVNDQGPFSDHLWYHLQLLRNEPNLKKALKQVILHNRCQDNDALFRLQRAGLVKESSGGYSCRCGLYTTFFRRRL